MTYYVSTRKSAKELKAPWSRSPYSLLTMSYVLSSKGVKRNNFIVTLFVTEFTALNHTQAFDVITGLNAQSIRMELVLSWNDLAMLDRGQPEVGSDPPTSRYHSRSGQVGERQWYNLLNRFVLRRE